MIVRAYRALLGAGAALVIVVFASPAVAEPNTYWKCNAVTEVALDERIAACTSVLESGKYGAQGLIRARFNRAGAYNKKGKFESAVADYSALIKLYPQNMYAYYCRAYSYHQLGDFDRSLADYSEAIRLNPSNQRAYYSRGLTYAKKGDFDRAIADYTSAIQNSPQQSQGDASGGGVYFNGGDLAPGVASGQATRITIMIAYVARGFVQMKKDNFDAAIADFEQAMQLDPNYAVAILFRSAAYRAKQDFPRAMADCDRAILIDPDDGQAYSCRGTIYLALNEPKLAVAAYDRAIELKQNSAKTYRQRAIAYLQAGSIAEAISDLDRTKELEPKDHYTAIWREIAGWRSNTPGLLTEAVARLDMTKWPAPVIRLLLGTMTPEELLGAADDSDLLTKKGRVCEANFYTAELALLRGAKEEAQRLFALARSDCPPSFIESQAASAELKALGVNP